MNKQSVLGHNGTKKAKLHEKLIEHSAELVRLVIFAQIALLREVSK